MSTVPPIPPASGPPKEPFASEARALETPVVPVAGEEPLPPIEGILLERKALLESKSTGEKFQIKTRIAANEKTLESFANLVGLDIPKGSVSALTDAEVKDLQAKIHEKAKEKIASIATVAELGDFRRELTKVRTAEYGDLSTGDPAIRAYMMFMENQIATVGEKLKVPPEKIPPLSPPVDIKLRFEANIGLLSEFAVLAGVAERNLEKATKEQIRAYQKEIDFAIRGRIGKEFADEREHTQFSVQVKKIEDSVSLLFLSDQVKAQTAAYLGSVKEQITHKLQKSAEEPIGQMKAAQKTAAPLVSLAPTVTPEKHEPMMFSTAVATPVATLPQSPQEGYEYFIEREVVEHALATAQVLKAAPPSRPPPPLPSGLEQKNLADLSVGNAGHSPQLTGSLSPEQVARFRQGADTVINQFVAPKGGVIKSKPFTYGVDPNDKSQYNIVAEKSNPDDEELEAMVRAYAMSGQKVCEIKACENNPEAGAKLYMLSRVYGLAPTFKPEELEKQIKEITESTNKWNLKKLVEDTDKIKPEGIGEGIVKVLDQHKRQISAPKPTD